jgi:TolB-like protein/DNA-binding winged helix-turn-helix (wHTH) protein/tetratricopeptide (TPR) repeat protein
VSGDHALTAGFWLGYVRVDPSRNTITLPDGEPRTLDSDSMAVLLALVARAHQAVPRETLLDEVWGAGQGSHRQLEHVILRLREWLGDDRQSPRYIETVLGQAYRCVAQVTPVATAARAATQDAASNGPAGTAAPADPRDSILPPFSDDPLMDAVLSDRRPAHLFADLRPAPAPETDAAATPPPRWRKLLRIVGIYVVVVAFVLQFASVALPALMVPDWVMTLIVVVAGAGLPVIVAGANWMLGRAHPAKANRAADLMLSMGLVMLAVLTYLWAADRFVTDPAPAVADRTGVAVLRFTTPGLTNDAYLGEGLPDAIISGLSNIPGLRVPPVSSTFSLSDTNFGTVSQDLHVRYVLEGSIRRRAQALVISLRIWDAVDEQPRMSWTLERPSDDIFNAINTIVLEVARVIASDADPDLLATAVTSQRTTSNEEAYLAYLEGRTLWKRRDEASVREAILRFEKAVSLDNGFARAYANLASTSLHLAIYGLEPEARAMASAEVHAEQALSLGTGIGEAYAVLGMIKLLRWDWAGAEQQFLNAIAAEPNEPLGHHWYSTFLNQVGRGDDALAQARQLQTLDPLSPAVSNRVAWAQLALGRYEDARSWFRRAREAGIRQEFFAGYAQYLIDEHGGVPQVGAMAFRRTLSQAGLAADWLDAFVAARATGADTAAVREAERALRHAFTLEDVSERQRLLFLSVLLPDPTLAIEVLTHMQDNGRGLLGVTLWLPDASALRASPDFDDAVQRMGLARYWQQRGCNYDGAQYRCRRLEGAAAPGR